MTQSLCVATSLPVIPRQLCPLSTVQSAIGKSEFVNLHLSTMLHALLVNSRIHSISISKTDDAGGKEITVGCLSKPKRTEEPSPHFLLRGPIYPFGCIALVNDLVC